MPRLPLYKIPLPLYKPGRTSWTHKLQRHEYLNNPAVKYPIYNRLPSFWRNDYEEKMPIIHQVEQEGRPRPQHGGLWNFDSNRDPVRVHNTPIEVYYPPEAHEGIWGGEGYIRGIRYAGSVDKKVRRKYSKVWKPIVLKQTLYSEILDRTISTTVTPLTLNLIDEAFGFDYFILKTSVTRLQKFGSKLKREMLLTLARKDVDLYPDNPEKREKIYNKYKEYELTEERASWVGLTLVEAMHKQWDKEKKNGVHDPVPLLEIYTKQLKEKLKLESGESPDASGVTAFEMGNAPSSGS